MEFLYWLEMIKKTSQLSDSEEADKVQGSDKHNLQHSGDRLPVLTWDNVSSAHLQWVITTLLKLFSCVNCCHPSSSCQNPPLGIFSERSDPDAGGRSSLGPLRGCCTRLITREDVLRHMKMKQLGKNLETGS